MNRSSAHIRTEKTVVPPNLGEHQTTLDYTLEDRSSGLLSNNQKLDPVTDMPKDSGKLQIGDHIQNNGSTTQRSNKTVNVEDEWVVEEKEEEEDWLDQEEEWEIEEEIFAEIENEVEAAQGGKVSTLYLHIIIKHCAMT